MTDGIGLEKSLIQIYRSRSESESELESECSALRDLICEGHLYSISYRMWLM